MDNVPPIEVVVYSGADPNCGFIGSSHTNSARLAALLLKDQLES
ncbi:MAG: hypothetical protein ACTSRL_08980 [Candidatus Helarchaeota archaeon]